MNQPRHPPSTAGLIRTKFCQSYFLGEGFGKTLTHLFLNSDVASGGGGVWGGIFHLLPVCPRAQRLGTNNSIPYTTLTKIAVGLGISIDDLIK